MPPRAIAWICGGALCGAGILNLLFSFGTPYGDIALSLDKVGFDAVEDVTVYPRFLFSVLAIGLGAPLLVYLNATQWKNTGGY